jgi:hypothetical protein
MEKELDRLNQMEMLQDFGNDENEQYEMLAKNVQRKVTLGNGQEPMTEEEKEIQR